MIISSSILKSQVHECSGRSARTRGFTLVEIMVTVTLLSIIMASMIGSFLVFSKGMAGLSNYSEMSNSSRQTLEHFARDAHSADTLLTANSSEFKFTVPEDAGGYTLHYIYDSDARSFTRMKYSEDGTLLWTQVLFEDIKEEAGAFEMIFYNRMNVDVTTDSSVLIEAKTVQIDAKLVKKVINQSNTDHIISARFLMRNM